MFTIKLINKKNGKTVSYSSEKIFCGAECCFIPTSKYRGLKLYFDRENAHYAFRMNKKAFKHGFAPYVYSRKVNNYSLVKLDYDKISFLSKLKYCEKHRELREFRLLYRDGLKHRKDPNNIWGFFVRKAENVGQLTSIEYRDKIEDMSDEIEQKGISYTDNHEWNVGEINNKLVFIDFGALTASPSR